MSACDNKLKTSLIEAMELEQKQLETEMLNAEPHVFSDIHEKKMEKLLQRQKRKQKLHNTVRFAVAACIVLLFIGSIFVISSKDLRASKLSIDIIEWLEEFFSVEQGEDERRKEKVIFEEGRIEYLPEGFEKTAEFANIAMVYYKYENEMGKMIQITVGRDKSSLQIDNTEDVYEVLINEDGYEYSGTFNEKTDTGALVWKGENELYYDIVGSVEYEELIKVMNGISY